MIITSVCQQSPSFNLTSNMWNCVCLWFGHECCPVVLVNVVVLLLTFSTRPNINKVNQNITILFLFVISAFKCVQRTLPCIFNIIPCKTNTIQIKLIFNFCKGLLQFLSAFEWVIKNFIDAWLCYFKVSSGDDLLCTILDHAKHFSVGKIVWLFLIFFTAVITLLHNEVINL